MKIAQIAIASKLHRVFDYYWPDDSEIRAGQRVTVPFGRRTLVGIVLGSVAAPSVSHHRMRQVTTIHEREPILPPDLLKLLHWSSAYYHYPLGEVLASALPVQLRKGAQASLPTLIRYRIQAHSAPSTAAALQQLNKAPLQRAVYLKLGEAGDRGLDSDQIKILGSSWRTALKQLQERGWLEIFEVDDHELNTREDAAPELLTEQASAIHAITAGRNQFHCFLLHGVTGSGKTEVYLQLIRGEVDAGRQCLVLAPEISLTPQLLARFRKRIPGCIVSLHSGLNDTERLHHWMLAASGKADVVIGTRSAIFTPLPRLGLIIIDEEHDGSLKQQDGFRYHARDLALMRARDSACPVVLGTATPSLETLNNARTGRYTELKLTQRAGVAESPDIALMDIRRRPLQEGMSDRLLLLIREHLDADGQVLIFLNRRGYAPTLLCNDCGAAADCKRCDAHMTVHAKLNCLRCHHCGSERAVPVVCEACGSERLDRVGQGTERIEAALKTEFPDVRIARIDRDSTRRKGSLQQHLDDAVSGRARILVGTQMLAKGHHFPAVSLVGILDADRGLFGTDFRALEQMGQLIIQVAGRAGREARRGKVLVQTRNPDNEMLQILIRDGYDAFAQRALDERRAAMLPPFSYVALIRAEAAARHEPHEFLRKIVDALSALALTELQYFGPVAAPMERRGGRYRAQLMVQSANRATLNQALAHITSVFDESAVSRRTRWSIDVDPVDFL